MKILVLSDSHSSYHFMRRTIDELKPDAVIHLGDHYSDGQTMAEEYPNITFYLVPGNCDRYREGMFEPETKLEIIGGVRLLLTHGHNHRVKTGLHALLADARASRVSAVLFGHTHMSYCHQEEDGLWVVNPGSAGYGRGTAALLEISGGKIDSCCIICPLN